MEFKSAYLGDTEIIKAYKGDTLFYEKQQGGYVQDGLVLFLDGLNQGGEAGKWIDTVNGREFTLKNAIQYDSYVKLRGGNVRNSDSTPFKTIEIVMRVRTGGGTYSSVFTANSSNRMGVYRNDTKISFGHNSSAPSVTYTQDVVQSFSAIFNAEKDGGVYTSVLLNNASVPILSGDSWSSGIAGTNIGYYNGQFPLYADIFALRLYNQALTSAERTQNYNLDVQRFGL